jgi:hypothetical protein
MGRNNNNSFYLIIIHPHTYHSRYLKQSADIAIFVSNISLLC